MGLRFHSDKYRNLLFKIACNFTQVLESKLHALFLP
jgi:hypothetical protein